VPGVDVLSEITIDRAVEHVAKYAGDPTNAPAWYVNITSVAWETPPVVAVGARATFVARFLGRTLRYTYEITELVPDERLVMRTTQGPFPMETTYTWSSHGDRATTMTLRNRGEPRGVFTLTAPVLAAAMRRANGKDLRRLKSMLE
jgi:uncharacterized protein YndB with AHSA1/START domain